MFDAEHSILYMCSEDIISILNQIAGTRTCQTHIMNIISKASQTNIDGICKDVFSANGCVSFPNGASFNMDGFPPKHVWVSSQNGCFLSTAVLLVGRKSGHLFSSSFL